MKLVLKDGMVTLIDAYGPLLQGKDKVVVVTKYLKEFATHKLEYSFNGGEFQPVVKGMVKLSEDLIDSQEVVIKFNMRKWSDNSITETFTSDVLPLAKYFYFGKPMEEAYPLKIRELESLIKNLTARIEELETSGDLF